MGYSKPRKFPNMGKIRKEILMKNNIASERVRLGLSQETLAVKLGVSRDSVKDWESGETAIRSTMLIRMADLFDCSLDYLMARSDERLIKGAAA